MTVQDVVRVCLVLIWVWLLICVHRSLLIREWKRLQKRRRAKRRKQAQKNKKPKPFEGLTRQPVCELCVAEEEKQEEERERESPPRIERARGRRPTVDTRNHFCPPKACRYYGWLDRGNIISNGHPGGGQWRQKSVWSAASTFKRR